jgi:hypothetical protein
MSFEKKISAIKKRTAQLEAKVRTMSDMLLKALIDNFVDSLEVEGGIIKDTPKNVALLAQIDKTIGQFASDVIAPEMTKIIDGGINEIGRFNNDYFSQFADSKVKYEISRKKVSQQIRDRMGFGKKTQLKEGGFMDAMFKMNGVKDQIYDFTRTNLIKGPGLKDFREGLRTMIVSDKDRLSPFERHFRQYAYDIFVNVDREESLLMAKDLKLTYFIYSGTLIDTSREFCIERAGNVFTMDEAKKWINDPWIVKNLERGYISSYNPVNDMGLFGCRHVPQFISKEVAEKLRPDLKKGSPPPTPKPEDFNAPKPTPAAPKEEAAPVPVDPDQFAPAKTINESSQSLNRHIGKQSGLNISKINPPPPTMSIDEFNKKAGKVAELFSEYELNPALDKKTGIEVLFQSTKGAFGFVSSYSYKPTIEKINFGDKTDFHRNRAFLPKSTILRGKSRVDEDKNDFSTIVHEFAHVIFVDRHLPFGGPVVEKFYEQLKILRKAYKSDLRKLEKAGDKEGINEIHLGVYAGTNHNEFMAEAFTEFKLSSNPSKYAKKVGELIDKTFKK